MLDRGVVPNSVALSVLACADDRLREHLLLKVTRAVHGFFFVSHVASILSDVSDDKEAAIGLDVVRC